MICSSVNRDRFIPSVLSRGGLQPFLEELQGVTSARNSPSPRYVVAGDVFG